MRAGAETKRPHKYKSDNQKAVEKETIKTRMAINKEINKAASGKYDIHTYVQTWNL